jgi:hypothetical protein
VVVLRGDSMGDTLRRGDFALIDTTQTEIAGGGVSAILEENRSVVIYQVETSGPGRIRCTPRDRQYAPFELTLGEEAKIHRARGPKGHPIPLRDAFARVGGDKTRRFKPAGFCLPSAVIVTLIQRLYF